MGLKDKREKKWEMKRGSGEVNGGNEETIWEGGYSTE